MQQENTRLCNTRVTESISIWLNFFSQPQTKPNHKLRGRGAHRTSFHAYLKYFVICLFSCRISLSFSTVSFSRPFYN